MPTMVHRPAVEIPAGSFVFATLGGARVVCLKVERVGKEHINHYLVPLDPVADRQALALIYLDPSDQVVPADGFSFEFSDHAEQGLPEVGDAFSGPDAVLLKVIDDPRSQRLHAYVDVTTGLLRPRMERHMARLLSWAVSRV